MTSRSYGHYCAVAQSLDLVGERWTLLIVRELLDGSKRYADLLAGLPGVSTNMLATRLAKLEDVGVITKRTLPPPSASRVYELTALGRDLRPLMTELARWGLRSIGERRDKLFQTHWLATALQARFQPEEADDIIFDVEFRVGRQTLRAHIADRALDTTTDGPSDPDLTLIFDDAETLVAVTKDPAQLPRFVSEGRVEVQGPIDTLELASRLFAVGDSGS